MSTTNQQALYKTFEEVTQLIKTKGSVKPVASGLGGMWTPESIRILNDATLTTSDGGWGEQIHSQQFGIAAYCTHSMILENQKITFTQGGEEELLALYLSLKA